MTEATEYTPAAGYLRAVAATQLVWTLVAAMVAVARSGADVLDDAAELAGLFAAVWLLVAGVSLRRVVQKAAPLEAPTLVPPLQALRREAAWIPVWLVALALVAFAPYLFLVVGAGALVQLLLSFAIDRWQAGHGRTLVRDAGRGYRGDFVARDFRTVER